MIVEPRTAAAGRKGFLQELEDCWRQMPDKGLFLAMLAAWLLLFQFLGNSTLGYVKTPSLYGWLDWMYRQTADDEHGRWIPLVVLALYWWKRNELLALPKRQWWPGLGLLILALLLQVVSFLIQQTQVSVVAFFLGLYALSGLVWGPGWLRATFFPFFLFAFCVPMANLAQSITFPLRLIATKITTLVTHAGLGINVLVDGTRIFESHGAYQYEVAAACSGIRSLLATVALAMIYSFVVLKTPWRRLVILLAAFPLAVISNVIRLTTIIVAAETFGQPAGNYVHNSGWLSLLPYLVAIGGILFMGHWLREGKTSQAMPDEAVFVAAEQKL